MGNASKDVAYITEVTLRALNTTRSHNLQRILPVMHRVVVYVSYVSSGNEHTTATRLNGKSSMSKHLDQGLPRRAHNAID